MTTNKKMATSATNPGAATQTNNYKGLVQKFHKGNDYVHISIHVIYILFQIIYNFEEGLKSFRREVGEKPLREVGKS
jgi:hypothetical protein